MLEIDTSDSKFTWIMLYQTRCMHRRYSDLRAKLPNCVAIALPVRAVQSVHCAVPTSSLLA
ncbi:hypothetical protein PAXRUDRAFT_287238 [Paxillus rubicundulus Ve08.2h10]|uniref:Uncharacterized protein n=1 Tax=Paxillus rubicundulus Ve08.2h10 TaxID=930991 RepID=A0A0D0E5Y7_9AGAM|nr:hypothetical protein PAXRUDRAFT_287238 [Paxillus rubicundulus Ve08.2h10]